MRGSPPSRIKGWNNERYIATGEGIGGGIHRGPLGFISATSPTTFLARSSTAYRSCLLPLFLDTCPKPVEGLDYDRQLTITAYCLLPLSLIPHALRPLSDCHPRLCVGGKLLLLPSPYAPRPVPHLLCHR